MPLLTYGINHKTAPISIREKWSFNHSQAIEALEHIKKQSAMNEAIILSTCNRTEIYTIEENRPALASWLQLREPAQHQQLQQYAYAYNGLDAIQHAMRVASGLDSMILGEPQIFGQMKQAYQMACDVGTVGHRLQQLFPPIFAASKTIRHNTNISKNSVSLAYVVFQVAKRIFSSLENCCALLIGCGEMIELIATHMNKQKTQKIIMAGRNIEKAQALADPHEGHAIRINDIPQYIKSADIVISATASPLPILGKGMIESTLRQKKHRPMLMIDLAVPRDIEPEVAALKDVYLYNIDDLQNLIKQNLKNRESAAKQAEVMITWQAEHYFKQLRILKSSDMISHYRHQIELLRDQELQKALHAIEQGHDAKVVLRNMARHLCNKIMHQPTAKLRQAAYDNKLDLLLLAKELFDL